MDIKTVLQKEFRLSKVQVNNIVDLIDAGNTIPFIARYRKEMTGSLDDQVLREFNDRYLYLKNLEARKQDVYRLIEEKGKMTDEVSASIEGAMTLQEIEDIYRPFKPKRRTRALIAREKGLEPLASLIMLESISDDTIESKAPDYIDPEKDLKSVDDVLQGARDIVAEEISDNASIRKEIRSIFHSFGIVESKAKKEEDSVYRQYYDYKEPVKSIVSHRILAINRGEKEEFLKVDISVPEEKVLSFLFDSYGVEIRKRKHMSMAIEDAYKKVNSAIHRTGNQK